LRYAFLLFIFLLGFESKSQDSKSEIGFVQYMISNESYDDLLYYFENEMPESFDRRSTQDSMYYYAGWVNYFKKRLETSVNYFENVSSTSELYEAASFYRALDYTYLNQYDTAKTIFNEFIKSEQHTDLAKYELCVLALLSRDLSNYDSLYKDLNKAVFTYKKQAEKLPSYREKAMKIKPKSAFLAGLLSALVPGLGKVYAGQPGQGMAAFFMNMSMAAVTGENLYRGGYDSPTFIASAAVFTIFYTGNILGSAFSAHNREKEANEVLDSDIIFDMHLPIRRTFQ